MSNVQSRGHCHAADIDFSATKSAAKWLKRALCIFLTAPIILLCAF